MVDLNAGWINGLKFMFNFFIDFEIGVNFKQLPRVWF